MPDLDLYKIHNLDRKAPSDAIAAQLTSQLNAAPDPLARQRIDTARAILGDPQRRARYDAHLADPQAPSIDEATLAAIADRAVPTRPSGLAAAFSQPNVRLMTIAAAVIGLVLIIVISAVSCGGGDDSSGPVTTVGADGSSTTKPATTTTAEKLTLESARAIRNDLPVADLPAQLKVVGQVSLADQPGIVTDKIYLVQPDEQTVRAYWIDRTNDKKSQETWVDLALGDGGKSLTIEGPTRSETVLGYGPEPGEPFTSGARKGVPDPTVGEKSGVFLFAPGAPGEVASEAPKSQKENCRKVVSAFAQGGYVYLTVLGFPGVLIAELEKTQG